MARRCFPVAKIGSSNLPGVARAKSFFNFLTISPAFYGSLPYFPASVLPMLPCFHPFRSSVLPCFRASVPPTPTFIHQLKISTVRYSNYRLSDEPFLSPLDWSVYPPSNKGRWPSCVMRANWQWKYVID